MFNINKVMEREYREAPKPKTDSSYKLKLFILALQVIAIELYSYFKCLIRLFRPRKPQDISKKLALVTGGGNGLGRSISFRLAQEGCDLAIADIDYKSACKTAKEIQAKYNVNCRPFFCDVSNRAAICKLKDDIESEMRGVDILVNNAGLLYVGNFLESELEDIERTTLVNLAAPMMMTRVFIPGMIERKYGRILTICSVASIVGGPLVAVYSATKRGLDGFMKAVENDILCSGNGKYIKLTTVHPDFTHTRQEISTILDKMNHFLPRLTPERVVKDAIDGFLAGKSQVYSSDLTAVYFGTSLLSENARRFILKHSPFNLKAFYTKKQ